MPSSEEEEDFDDDSESESEEEHFDDEENGSGKDSDNEEETYRKNLVVQALGFQSAHIPGNTHWCQDYLQFVITNNHTVFGIFCFHPCHPLRYGVRLAALVGSLGMSLALYNVIYVYLESVASPTVEKVLNTTTRIVDAFSGQEISSEQLVVTIIGSPLLTFFDLAIWGIAALPCCLPGHVLGSWSSWRWIGKFLVVVIIMCVSILSFWIVVLRTGVYEAEDQLNGTIASGGLVDDVVNFGDALEATFSGRPETVDFIVGGLIQFAFTMLFTRIFASSVAFVFKYPKNLEKYEKKLKNYKKKLKGSSSDRKSDATYTHEDGSESDYSVYEGNESDDSSRNDGSSSDDEDDPYA
mmetsp:Transcript_4839/g.8001  ORF Transcript_4839/g.8001 Transcript_4839/m.8001 type:complete len:353 (-) Transcript_4839:262-1320(-)|eukprot:CAMPEP_0119006104 /NCGR_PEP_ID=MMETSP1176-20130426/2115_1 /TAXON_ID=265551 /ORGANISM="Synedropsis recta cf, Strain CCMP1620" /LENGTH=352 /DNA_ID=CAMNT_0006957991 /DNA_START=59 /DNA_END=1117 /DNA_ORIENTATION=+